MFKLSGVLGMSGSLGLVLAQVAVPKPGDFEGLGVTSILAFLVCVSLGMNFFLMKSFFTTLQKHTEQLQRSTDSAVELCARMNQRPCLKRGDK